MSVSDEMKKIKNFPVPNCISLEESSDRRTNLKKWFEEYGIENYNFHLFKRIFEYKDIKFEGPLVHTIDEFSKGTSSSHLSVLRKWYYDTTEPYTLVFEDDVSFETIKYWNFTWDDFFKNLPNDWNCVQLVVKLQHPCDAYEFHYRTDFEWSAAGYLIKREYVKYLLDNYHPKPKVFILDIKETNIVPTVEQVLFLNQPYNKGVYSFPLFVEEAYKFPSTNIWAEIPSLNYFSYDNVLNWWKTKGSQLTIEDIFKLKKREMNWGISNKGFIDFISKEIFEDRIYEKFYEVKKDDIVVDIGASAGPFTYSILNKLPKHVYCIEPSKNFYDVLCQNVKDHPVTCINKAIVSEERNKENTDDLHVFWTDSLENIETTTFRNFISENNITKIDMLKLDCEGGEYDIFTEENLDFIINHVHNIAAELHFVKKENRLNFKFKQFKEKILPKLSNYKIYSFEPDQEAIPIDVTDKINIPNYLENQYEQLTLYVKKEPFPADKGKRKIIDCFRFFNEKELLELRYNILKNKVDKFVVLEGTKTQSGHSWVPCAKDFVKELELPEDKFIFVTTNLPGNEELIENSELDIIFRSKSSLSGDSYKNSLNARTRERMQLDGLLTIIEKFSKEDIFFVSDCDEIIHPDCVDYFADMASKNIHQLIKVPLVELHGAANFRVYDKKTKLPISTDNVFFLATKKHFEKATPTQLRFDILNPFEVTYVFQDGNRLEECGWHFSWMGNSEKMKFKLKSTSHYADQIESTIFKDLRSENLQKHLEKWKPKNGGMNSWGDLTTFLRKYPLKNLPKEITENKKFREFFIIQDDFEIPHIYDQPQFGENWFSYPNLYSFVVDNFSNGAKFVEVGSWKGKSSSYMCVEIANSKKDIKFYCVDTWKGSEEHKENTELAELYKIFTDNMSSLKDYYIPLKMSSLQAAEKFEDKSLDFVFIDAAHDYENVKSDILAWLPKVKEGGILAGHDYYENDSYGFGVKKAVNELFNLSKLQFSENCWIYNVPKNTKKRKVIDAFMFFNEVDILKLRLNYLNDVVDHFVISECSHTHSGQEKPYYLDKIWKDIPKDIRDKIIRLKFEPNISEYKFSNDVKEYDFENDNWKLEKNQRNFISKNLNDFCLTDVFILSDVDEIPRKEVILNLAFRDPSEEFCYALESDFFYYNFNTVGQTKWVGSAVTTVKTVLEKECDYIRTNISNFEKIQSGGWHFSYFGDISCIQNKIKSFAHQEYNKQEFISEINLSRAIKNKKDLFNRDEIFQDYNFVNFPENLQNSIKKIFTKKYYTNTKPESIERTDIIKHLIEKINAKKYLEIGVSTGENLEKINCSYKIGVDPNPNSPANFHITSDEFFEKNQEKFDVIFIDGLHHSNQVLRDILNSLDILNEGGYIVCHDMNPVEEEYQIVPFREGTTYWTGDCWKAFVELRKTRTDLNMFVVNSDFGCGIIQKGSQNKIIVEDELTYQNFAKNRKEWLNLIEVEEFYDRINNRLKIPVIGVPIVNGVHWLQRLINSIDYPVRELFIVNNNGRDQITDELDNIAKLNHPFIEKIRVCHLPHNLGVGGAWNLIIKSYLMSPYWIICNNDFAFTPGFLKEMVEKSENSSVGMVCPPSINANYIENELGSFECFLLKDEVVQKCGLFDENLYPAYCEDCDYLIKIKANNIKVSFVKSPYYHGESQNYTTGSQTLKSEPLEISKKIHDAHMKNIQYINDTWGKNWEKWEDYSNRDIIIQSKLYDINFNRKKYLGF